mgnify:CR=1 FL=1
MHARATTRMLSTVLPVHAQARSPGPDCSVDNGGCAAVQVVERRTGLEADAHSVLRSHAVHAKGELRAMQLVHACMHAALHPVPATHTVIPWFPTASSAMQDMHPMSAAPATAHRS